MSGWNGYDSNGENQVHHHHAGFFEIKQIGGGIYDVLAQRLLRIMHACPVAEFMDCIQGSHEIIDINDILVQLFPGLVQALLVNSFSFLIVFYLDKRNQGSNKQQDGGDGK